MYPLMGLQAVSTIFGCSQSSRGRPQAGIAARDLRPVPLRMESGGLRALQAAYEVAALLFQVAPTGNSIS